MKFKNILSQIFVVLITIPCFIITLYILVNSYEIIFHRDLQYVHAMDTFESPEVITQIVDINDPEVQAKQQLIRTLYNPQSLKFPDLKYKLELVPALERDDNYLIYANKGQFIGLNENSESGVGNSVVFLRRDWRTIYELDRFAEGKKFYLDAEKFTNLYKIVDIKIKKTEERYILTELSKPYLLLIIEDPKNKVNYFIKAIFVSKEEKI